MVEVLEGDVVRVLSTIQPPLLKALQHLGEEEDISDPLSSQGGDSSADVVR